MLGNPEPWLLVLVDDHYDSEHFEFYVVNGNWKGKFYKGQITVLGPPNGSFSSLVPVSIICDNRDRLRGEYQIVFENFDNTEYEAPPNKTVVHDDFDDDIPF